MYGRQYKRFFTHVLSTLIHHFDNDCENSSFYRVYFAGVMADIIIKARVKIVSRKPYGLHKIHVHAETIQMWRKGIGCMDKLNSFVLSSNILLGNIFLKQSYQHSSCSQSCCHDGQCSLSYRKFYKLKHSLQFSNFQKSITKTERHFDFCRPKLKLHFYITHKTDSIWWGSIFGRVVKY